MIWLVNRVGLIVLLLLLSLEMINGLTLIKGSSFDASLLHLLRIDRHVHLDLLHLVGDWWSCKLLLN